MLAVTKWTLRQRKWSTVWWAVGIGAFILVTLIFYPSLRSQTSQLDQSFQSLPQSAKDLFTDTPDLFSPVGYLSSQVFYLMLPLLFSVLAIGLGSSLIAKEESSGTLELLLSRPISRGRLVAEKALAGLVVLGVVGASTIVVTVVICKLINMGVGFTNISVAVLYALGLAMLYGSIAYFVACLGRVGRVASVGVAVLIALGSYIIASLAGVVSWLATPSKILPNHYYHPGDILAGNYTWWALLVFTGITILFVALAAIAFRRRDVLGN